MRKFNLGDPARFTKRVPKMIRGKHQARARRVSSIFYDTQTQSTRYYLGKLDYPFRSYMLKRVKKEEVHCMGRPKTKRRYRKLLPEVGTG